MIFDVLVIGGGAAGMSCALVLGSAKKESGCERKKYWNCSASAVFGLGKCDIL